MQTHTKIFGLTTAALLMLTLLSGASATPTARLAGIEETPPRLTRESAAPAPPPSSTADAATRARVEAALNRLPICFIENRGQLDERVAYYIQGHDKTIYFTPDGVTIALSDPTPRPPSG